MRAGPSRCRLAVPMRKQCGRSGPGECPTNLFGGYHAGNRVLVIYAQTSLFAHGTSGHSAEGRGCVGNPGHCLWHRHVPVSNCYRSAEGRYRDFRPRFLNFRSRCVVPVLGRNYLSKGRVSQSELTASWSVPIIATTSRASKRLVEVALR